MIAPISYNTIGAEIAQNALRSNGIDPSGMDAAALSAGLQKLFPDERFTVTGYVAQAPATKTSVTGGTNTSTAQPAQTVSSVSYNDALSILRNKNYDPTGMSQAEMEAALLNTYTFPLKVTGYPSAATTGTTFVNPYGPTTGTTTNTTAASSSVTPPAFTGDSFTTSPTAARQYLTNVRKVDVSGMSDADMLAKMVELLGGPRGKYEGGDWAYPAGYVNPAAITTAPATKTTVTGTKTGGTSPSTNPLTEFGPPASLAPPPVTVTPPNINSFMTRGVTFPPRTQFNQTASAPLNISQQGNTYGAPAPNFTLAITPPPTQFKSVQPGGAVGAVPVFQNPFTAPATSFTANNEISAEIARNALINKGFAQGNVAGMDANQLATEMGRLNPGESFKIVNFADGGLTGTNNMNGMTGMVPQFQNPFGPQQPPFGQSMYTPQQQQQQRDISVGGTPQQPGLPGLLSVGSNNSYPQGYTPIGQQPQKFPSLNYNG